MGTARTTRRISALRGAVLALALLGSLALSGVASSATYKWVDANGRVVYSDQPPPGNVKAEIVQGAPPPANPNAVKELAAKEAEFKKRQIDAVDNAKKVDAQRAERRRRPSSARARRRRSSSSPPSRSASSGTTRRARSSTSTTPRAARSASSSSSGSRRIARREAKSRKGSPRFGPEEVSAKIFGRPGEFRAETARSAPIISRCAAVQCARMPQ